MFKIRAEYPDWETKAVCLIRDTGAVCEWCLCSYGTFICGIKYTTKTQETRITFNKEPYIASATTGRHLKWFLEKYLSKYELKELMTATKAKSFKALMYSNIDYTFKHDA